MKFSEWVLQFPNVEAENLARRLVAEEKDLTIEAVTAAVEHVRRSVVREIESRAFARVLRTLGDRPTVTTEVVDGEPTVVAASGRKKVDISDFMNLLKRPFALGNGRNVLWGEAKREQHETRIEMLRLQVKGFEATIRRHEQAVAALRKSGARCLNDLVRSK